MDDRFDLFDNDSASAEDELPIGDDVDIFATFGGTEKTGEHPIEEISPAPAQLRASGELPAQLDSFDLASFETKQAADTGKQAKARRKKRAVETVTVGEQEYKQIGFFKQLLIYICNLFLTVCCLVVIVGCVVATLMVVYVVDVTKNDGDLLAENNLKLGYTTILYAADPDTGEYFETQRLYGKSNRIWVDYADIPQHMIDAVKAVEDKRFDDHNGVDWIRTFAAFFNQYVAKIFPSLQGGSTITQQLIKNITRDSATDPISGALRKLREIYRALVIENNHSKEEIMEAYLNTIPLSGLIAGVEAGANTYFCKSVSELSVAESCAVICITNKPTAYNPLRNPETNRERVLYILKQMYEQEKLTYDEWQQARAEALVLPYANTVDENGNYVIERLNTSSSIYSYFTDMVIDDVLNDLVSIGGMTRSAAQNLFWNKGLRVYTTMDKKVQAACEAAGLSSYWPTRLNSKGKSVQGSAIVLGMDGKILGVLGGVGKKTESRGLNRAVGSMRQTGSAMKPIGVYGPALEADAINYSTVFEDQPLKLVISGVLQLYPVNYERTYGNPRTVADAIAFSKNTCAVRCLMKIGYNYSYSFLQSRLGVSTLWGDYDRTFSSLALGGLYNGISLREIAGAYLPFANGGMYFEPHSYTTVTDANGVVLINKELSRTTLRAYSTDTAYIMNLLLRNVFDYGTARTASLGSKFVHAGKTGTTNDDKDYQIVCFNPHYLLAVRVGFDYPTPLTTAEKSCVRLTLQSIMPAINKDAEAKEFPVDKTVTALRYCRASGARASNECTAIRTGYYKSGGKEGQVPDICNHSEWKRYSTDRVELTEEELAALTGG